MDECEVGGDALLVSGEARKLNGAIIGDVRHLKWDVRPVNPR